MSDTKWKWWWCAGKQAITRWPDEMGWPEECHVCGKKVNRHLSVHHDLFDGLDDVPWGNY